MRRLAAPRESRAAKPSKTSSTRQSEDLNLALAIEQSLKDSSEVSARRGRDLDESDDFVEYPVFRNSAAAAAASTNSSKSANSDEAKLSSLRQSLSRAMTRRVEAIAEEAKLSKEIKKLSKTLMSKKRANAASSTVASAVQSKVVDVWALGEEAVVSGGAALADEAAALWLCAQQEDDDALLAIERAQATALAAARDPLALVSVSCLAEKVAAVRALLAGEPSLEDAFESAYQLAAELSAPSPLARSLVRTLKESSLSEPSLEHEAMALLFELIASRFASPPSPPPKHPPVASCQPSSPAHDPSDVASEINFGFAIQDSPMAPSQTSVHIHPPIDLTASPNSPLQLSHLEAAHAQSSSSSDNYLSGEGSLPEGCFRYDPNERVEVAAISVSVSSRKRKEPAASTSAHDSSRLRSIPEEVIYVSDEERPSAAPASRSVDVPMLEAFLDSESAPRFDRLTETELAWLANKYSLGSMLGGKRELLHQVLRKIWERSQSSSIAKDSSAASKTSSSSRIVVSADGVAAFIRGNTAFYEQVISFTPVDLDQLHGALHAAQLQITKPKLQEALDEMGVFVTYGQMKTKKQQWNSRTKR